MLPLSYSFHRCIVNSTQAQNTLTSRYDQTRQIRQRMGCCKHKGLFVRFMWTLEDRKKGQSVESPEDNTGMRHLHSRSDCPQSPPSCESQGLSPKLQVKWLVIETVLVTGAVLAMIRVLHLWGYVNLARFAIPGFLVMASLVPTWISRRTFPVIGFDVERVRLALGAVCRVFIYILPMMFLAFWLTRRLNVPIPLRPSLGEQPDWLNWALYQFFYVAVSEEMFFRGYVQANIARVLECGRRRFAGTEQGITILVSAGCFALGHVIVLGQIVAVATFLPGVIMAWLFIRTRSLLAPILFHGLANVIYAVLATTLSR